MPTLPWMYVFLVWSPCHLLPYNLGRMLWGAGGAADVMFTEQGFPFSHGEGCRPLFRHSCKGRLKDHMDHVASHPCCEQKLSVVPFGSLTLPPARIYSEGQGRKVSKGSRKKGIKDAECRCHHFPCLQEPPWPWAPGP